MSPPFSILVVCTGNICRSPLAERLLQRELGSAYDVTSAGTHGRDGAEMEPTAAGELRRLGGDPTGFRSRPLRAELVSSAALVLTATRAHRSAVLATEPSALRRSFTLRELAWLAPRTEADDPAQLVSRAAAARSTAELDDYDVPDPYGGPAQRHREVPRHRAGRCGGVYLNDGTGAKMDYYLHYDVAVKSTGCDARGVQNLEATITIGSDAPSDARALPVSVTGPGYGAPTGTIPRTCWSMPRSGA